MDVRFPQSFYDELDREFDFGPLGFDINDGVGVLSVNVAKAVPIYRTERPQIVTIGTSTGTPSNEFEESSNKNFSTINYSRPRTPKPRPHAIYIKRPSPLLAAFAATETQDCNLQLLISKKAHNQHQSQLFSSPNWTVRSSPADLVNDTDEDFMRTPRQQIWYNSPGPKFSYVLAHHNSDTTLVTFSEDVSIKDYGEMPPKEQICYASISTESAQHTPISSRSSSSFGCCTASTFCAPQNTQPQLAHCRNIYHSSSSIESNQELLSPSYSSNSLSPQYATITSRCWSDAAERKKHRSEEPWSKAEKFPRHGNRPYMIHNHPVEDNEVMITKEINTSITQAKSPHDDDADGRYPSGPYPEAAHHAQQSNNDGSMVQSQHWTDGW